MSHDYEAEARRLNALAGSNGALAVANVGDAIAIALRAAHVRGMREAADALSLRWGHGSSVAYNTIHARADEIEGGDT